MGFSPQQPHRLPGFYRPQAEINVTPLVDVMLVLLIIFMVTAPLLAAGVKVDLPQARAARPLDPREPIVVAIGKDGGVSVGAERVEPADLAEIVKLKLGDDLSRVVHLRGDRDAPYGRIVAALDQLASHGITHIAIVTETGGAPASGSDRRQTPDPAK
jgi:biopolymer transport protein TolR